MKNEEVKLSKYIPHLLMGIPTQMIDRSKKVVRYEVHLQLRATDLDYYLSIGARVLSENVIWIKCHNLK